MSTRDGTDVDAANVENTFSKLGYKVKVHHNQTAAQMKKLMLDGKKSFGSFMFTCVENDPPRAVMLKSVCQLILSAAGSCL